MRVLFDFSLASDDTGGPRTLMDGILRGWQRAFPADSLAVFGPEHFRDGIESDVELIVPKMRIPPQRMVQQQVELPLRHRAELKRSDVVVVPNIGCTLAPLGRPIVGTLCDLKHLRRSADFGSRRTAYRRLMWPAYSRRMSAVVSISQFSLDEARAFGFPLPNIQVVAPLGTDHVSIPGQDTIVKEHKVICVAHRASKVSSELATVWSQVERRADVAPRLVVTGVGAGPVRESIIAQFETLGLATRPEFLPYLSSQELYAAIASSRALVYMSKYEGYGLVPSEATALGTRSFTYDLPSYRERAASLSQTTVALEDADGLGTALAEYLNDPVDPEVLSPLDTWCETAERYRSVASRVSSST